MASIVSKNNSKNVNSQNGHVHEDEKCNCRNKNDCPLPGKCLISGVIYQAQVETRNSKKTYVGLMANSFKARYSGHKYSFKKTSAGAQ